MYIIQKKGFFFIILLVLFSFKIYAATDTTYVGCTYGNGIYACSGSGQDYATCSASIAGGQCAYEGAVTCYASAAGGTEWDSAAAYTVNWDSSQAQCDCYWGSSGHWNMGGDISSCCGDDANEYAFSRIITTDCSAEAGVYSSSSDNACCNSVNDCVYGDVCYANTYISTCYCSSGTWYGPDDSSAACGALVGAKLYNIGGDVSNCCGDDANEFHKYEAGPAKDLSGSDACCDNNNDCVDESNCYSDNSCVATGSDFSFEVYCDGGAWYDNDASSTYCNACVGSGSFNIGGEITGCCGDDYDEIDRTELGATDSSDSDACCDYWRDCVDDNICYSTGTCHNTGSSVTPNEYCSDATWYDNDASSAACSTCSTGLYNIGGIPNCCGDDANENQLWEAGTTDGSNSDACCDSTSDCVDDNSCYNPGSCHDTGSSVSYNEYCTANTWHDNDDSSTYCTACVGAGKWSISGDIDPTECCEDDPGEWDRNEEGAVDGSISDACCDAESDCTDDDTCYPQTTSIVSCHDTGSTASFDEYCDAHVWRDNDDSQLYCDTCVGQAVPYPVWSIGGDATGASSCCEDDNNEFRNYMNGRQTGTYYDVVWTDDNNIDACCDTNNDCVGHDGVCYSDHACISGFNPGGNDDYSTCEWGPSGTDWWFDPDYNSDSCDDCSGLFWEAGGETAAFGEYDSGLVTECCGDDANEYYRSCDDSSRNGECGTDTLSCCDIDTDCIDHDANCQTTGSCYQFETLQSFCNAGQWEDPDENQAWCEAAGCTYAWAIDLGACCGDDTDYDTDEHCYQDIGLRYYDGTQTRMIAVEWNPTQMARTSPSVPNDFSPLKIFKNSITYSIALVDVGHTKDSGIHIQTSSGIKALRRFDGYPY
ncbi:hypothetical protein K9M79_04875 [Candidatus Woesearchaeota archaeon]|nr:hypothetical protein [Candidatus Woesearchaeota archaeon]